MAGGDEAQRGQGLVSGVPPSLLLWKRAEDVPGITLESVGTLRKMSPPPRTRSESPSESLTSTHLRREGGRWHWGP